MIADPQLLLAWAEALRSGGGAGWLAATGQMVLYPPLSALVISFAGFGASAIATIAALKALAMAADVCLAAVVAGLLTGRSRRVRVGAAAGIALNPALWYLSAIWGQIDSVYALLMVVAVAALGRRHGVAGWAAWGAACLWKLQALVLGPLMLAETLSRGRLRDTVRGVAIAGALGGVSTYLLFGFDHWGAYFSRLWRPGQGGTISAFNAWHLLQPLARSFDGTLVGYLLVAVVAAIVVIALWRAPDAIGLAFAALILTLGPFVLLTGMHERYLIAALPFAVLVAAGWETGRVERGPFIAAVVLSATHFLNLIAVGSPFPALWTNVFLPLYPGSLQAVVATLGYLAAALNVAVLAWALARLVRAAGRAAKTKRPPAFAGGLRSC